MTDRPVGTGSGIGTTFRMQFLQPSNPGRPVNIDDVSMPLKACAGPGSHPSAPFQTSVAGPTFLEQATSSGYDVDIVP